MNWVWRLLAAVVIVIVVGGAAGYAWLRTGLPTYDGVVHLTGLEAPVQVIHDRHAVPHIFAANEDDAYFTLGYLHAANRLYQMEVQRLIAAGRVAEVVGDSGLRLDRFMRLLGLYSLAEASVGTLPDDVLRAVTSYTAGVNAWLEHHGGALPPEFYLMRHRPEPWRPADSLVWGRMIALQLSGNFRTELLRAEIAEQVGPDRLAALFPEIGAPPVTLAGHLPGADAAALTAAIPSLGPQSASNLWVVSGEASATGSPILANDPHLGLLTPILWYLARIETPSLSIAGATVPGVPFMVLGHNKTIAWGLTTTGTDVQDLFIERLDPENPDHYLTPEGSEPFRVREEVIAVRGDDDVTLTVRETRNGPVISDILKEAADLTHDGEVVTLAYAALTPEDINAEAVFRRNRARDWAGFLEAMRNWRAPQQNVAYADASGNIGLIVPGDIPIRRSGDGSQPVPGWTGAYDWVGYIPFRELPQTYNPASGRLVNANNAVVGPDYPHFIGYAYEEAYRAARLEDMLDETAPHSVDDAQNLMLDDVSLAARDLLPLMLTVQVDTAREADALARLRRWDHSMDRERSEPLVFSMWLRELNRQLYADELGDAFGSYWGERPKVVRSMLETESAWCDRVDTEAVEDCQQILADSLTAALDKLEDRYGSDIDTWRWGQAHAAPLRHQILSRIPLVSSLVDLSIETDGSDFTINRGGSRISDERHPFHNVHGAGYRAIYDLSNLANSRFMIVTGQSGHALSPHYGDMVQRWRDGEFIHLAGSPGEVRADGLGTLTLSPEPGDGGAR